MKEDKSSCVSCASLHSCQLVDTRKLIDGFVCRDYSTAPATDIKARLEIVEEFGPWALGYETLSSIKNQVSVRPRTSRRRKRDG